MCLRTSGQQEGPVHIDAHRGTGRVLWASVPGDVLVVAGLWGEGSGKGAGRERLRWGRGRVNTGPKRLRTLDIYQPEWRYFTIRTAKVQSNNQFIFHSC